MNRSSLLQLVQLLGKRLHKTALVRIVKNMTLLTLPVQYFEKEIRCTPL